MWGFGLGGGGYGDTLCRLLLSGAGEPCPPSTNSSGRLAAGSSPQAKRRSHRRSRPAGPSRPAQHAGRAQSPVAHSSAAERGAGRHLPPATVSAAG